MNERDLLGLQLVVWVTSFIVERALLSDWKLGAIIFDSIKSESLAELMNHMDYKVYYDNSLHGSVGDNY